VVEEEFLAAEDAPEEILDRLAAGVTVDEILHEYPQLVRDDVLACIAYGSEMSRERYVDIPVTKPA